MSLSRVPGDDELYISGIFALRRPSALAAAKITHIVSALRYDFSNTADLEKYQHCIVPVDDVEDENLLGEFPRTGEFIREALKGGGSVLVHCAMGKSRSVAVTIAYLLLTRPETCPTPHDALSLIQQSRPFAEPNPGFMSQLYLYKFMKCPTDLDSQPAYQRWLYEREVALSIATGRAPETLRFEDEQNVEGDWIRFEEERSGGNDGTGNGTGDKELRCRKCRRKLATSQYIISHTPKTSLVSSSSSSTPTTCTSHFLQPLSWMRPTLEAGELGGRLECPNPKCAAQLGRYSWQGLKCSCSEWVVPGFSLQAGRVDFVPANPSFATKGRGNL